MATEALAGLYRLPPRWLRRLAGAPMRIDGAELDVQNHLVIRLAQLLDGQPLEQRSVEGARAAMERSVMFDPPRPRLGGVRDLTLGRPAHPLRARVYTPTAAGTRAPAVVYFHGGGWVIGSPRTSDAVAARLAAASESVVVSIDYRLAPEHAFPTAANDAVAAFDWVRAEHELLGIDPDRVAVAGDSAGGNLAAVVANAQRGAVKYQLLIYPVTDLSREAASYALYRTDLFLTDATMRWFIDLYAPKKEQRADPRASPLLADDLAGVAPACVVVVGFDPLRDEGRAYAARLDAIGALDTMIDEPTLSHGSVAMLSFVTAARELVDRAGAALHAGVRAS